MYSIRELATYYVYQNDLKILNDVSLCVEGLIHTAIIFNVKRDFENERFDFSHWPHTHSQNNCISPPKKDCMPSFFDWQGWNGRLEW